MPGTGVAGSRWCSSPGFQMRLMSSIPLGAPAKPCRPRLAPQSSSRPGGGRGSMRLWALAALTLLIAGCSSPTGPDPAAPSGDAPRNEAMELGRGSYMLGLPTTGPTDISAGLGFRVPDGFTHLTVTVRIT